ncbi:MAG: glycosyltransferase family 2 protein [Candidatus Omnitrophica bacterium]|nr:glycosyltransferase family 2 protein [Candidatus Omnitrophota bacterium]
MDKSKSHKIKLSICIPTLNRASFLAETLENVMSQSNDDVEIVIVDGASKDNTAEVVEGFRAKFKNFVYYRGEKNMGVNRDMAKTIEIAHGEYCWMLSDDDLLAPGAVARMLKEIKSGCEIYLCNITACNLKMQPYKDMFWLSKKFTDRTYSLHDKAEFIQYCDNSNSIGSLFSYMSSIVVNRQAWNKTGFHDDFDDTAYALASSLLSFIKSSCRLKYIRGSLVLWRNDNESFQNAGGLVKRFYLDFDGYLKLADKYLSDDKDMRSAFLRVMTREHPWYTIINVTSFIKDPKEWKTFAMNMAAFGYSKSMIGFCRFWSKNRGLVSFAVNIKRKIVRSGIHLLLNKNK